MKAERQIRLVESGKQKYLPLLLLGDEQETLIAGYLDRGDLFAWEQDGRVIAVCVVTREGVGRYELQNIAVTPQYRRQGVGRALTEFVWRYYPDLETLYLGTGDSPSTIGFYQALGFLEIGREKEYFICNYDHPIYEDGQRLRDRILFQKTKAP